MKTEQHHQTVAIRSYLYFAKKARRHHQIEALKGYLFIAPAFLIIFVIGFYPLLKTFYLSFFDTTFINPESNFIGFENYKKLFTDTWFKSSYVNTWYFTIVSVCLEAILGFAIALLLDKKLPGRKWLRVSVLIPWAIPTVVAASLFQWLFNGEYGVVNFVLSELGIIHSYQNWLGEGSSAMWVVIFADVWKTTPFMALILLAGLQGVSEEIYEAASIDGVSLWQRFCLITLPLLLPAFLTAFMLRALDAFRVFDLIYVLTGGGPANATEVLSSYAYKTTFSSTQVGYGATMSVLMALSVFVFALIMQCMLRLAYRKIGDR